MRALSPRSAGEWGAVLPQWVGMGGLLLIAVFWAVTSRIEPLLVSAFGGLIAIGQGASALVALRNNANGGSAGGDSSPSPPSPTTPAATVSVPVAPNGSTTPAS